MEAGVPGGESQPTDPAPAETTPPTPPHEETPSVQEQAPVDDNPDEEAPDADDPGDNDLPEELQEHAQKEPASPDQVDQVG